MPRHGRDWRGTKRKRSDKDSDSVAGALSRAKELDDVELQDDSSHPPNVRLDGQSQEQDDQGWQTVKKRKKNTANYPAITHAASARLQSFVKISDLQNLVLYLLADGNAPQWVSVRHHKDIEKIVVVMVPGLEADMFSGKIPLQDREQSFEKDPTKNSATSQELVAPAVGVERHEGTDDDTTKSVFSAQVDIVEPPHGKLKLSPDDYYPTKLTTQKLPRPLEPLGHIFPHIWPIKTPGEFNRMHSPLYAMLNAPIPRPKEDKKIKGPKPPAEGKSWQNKRTPITEYIATKEELAENGYALHPVHMHDQAERDTESARRYKACQSTDDGWVDLLDISTPSEASVPDADVEAGSILAGRRLLVADCEMVTTSADKFALARISLIDWDGKTVLDEFVKPPDPVTDYLTTYSGITKELLDTATLTVADIQQKLRDLLTPYTILAGHSLDSDFRALKISYPFIIDTALLYPHPKGPPQKSSLKWLSQKYLGREIQNRGAKGHDSVEDALACLDLIKQKCERGKLWGTPDATGEPIFRRFERVGQEARDGDGPNGSNGHAKGRTSAVVDWGNPMRGFGSTATVSIACETDNDVEDGIKKALLGDKNVSTIPRGGCDFVWARLRELEAVRGWFDKKKISDQRDRLAKVASALTDTTSEGDPSTGSINVADGQAATTADDSEPTQVDGELSPENLADAVTRTVAHLTSIHSFLPERTAYIVYSGSGDPREMVRLQNMHKEHKTAFQTMKWDELPVKWTDVEEQALKAAASKARSGIGFVCVK